jgi:thiol-disulfide isomerase/thioredoxin
MSFPFVSGRLLLGSAALLTTLLSACNSGGDKNATASESGGAATTATALTAGTWRGVLSAQGQEIPFLFDLKDEGGKQVVYLINRGINGEEKLRCDEISTAGDSTTIRLGAFDAALVVSERLSKAASSGTLTGYWVKYDAKGSYRVPFKASHPTPQTLFFGEAKERTDYPLLHQSQSFSVVFKDDSGETYPAVGIFRKEADSDKAYGTFLTTTGDYRYLSGNIVKMRDGKDHLQLATFDGSHGWLFDATSPDGFKTLTGDFYSGKSGHETWTAKLAPNAKLPDANALTGMKPGQKRLDFLFPNIFEGGSISPTDIKYKGKVVVVQVLGSWCPNCMDETNFLAPWYEQNKQRGVEIIGLGFERTPDQKLAAQKLLKMKQRMNIGYDLAVAGMANKDSASKALPQLAGVLAFPTTIFLDKKGEVRKVHTGFSGPGTGKYYEQEKADFTRTIDQLLAE